MTIKAIYPIRFSCRLWLHLTGEIGERSPIGTCFTCEDRARNGFGPTRAEKTLAEVLDKRRRER